MTETRRRRMRVPTSMRARGSGHGGLAISAPLRGPDAMENVHGKRRSLSLDRPSKDDDAR